MSQCCDCGQAFGVTHKAILRLPHLSLGQRCMHTYAFAYHVRVCSGCHCRRPLAVPVSLLCTSVVGGHATSYPNHVLLAVNESTRTDKYCCGGLVGVKFCN